ncbi:hypothetical protein MIZ03_4170 [Rhodoferax lithotrophicus]|uniref:Uncharacterized protein n=1 Tax=Rhodoferax lithotrophicus TaxID=2798804 RepID=A0ABN6DBB1_9BURK|nr:hypothetical protein MIZ03_4170 [Rhodoferax sp. MIZ03]
MKTYQTTANWAVWGAPIFALENHSPTPPRTACRWQTDTQSAPLTNRVELAPLKHMAK